MSSSRENSHGRHAPRDRERGEPRKRRHRSQNSKRQSREETVEDALDDFYGGTAIVAGSEENDTSYGETHRPSQARTSRPWTRTQSHRGPVPPVSQKFVVNASHNHHNLHSRPPGRVSNEDDLYWSEPPSGNWRKGLWRHAVQAAPPRGDESPEHTVLSLEPVLIVIRRGRRLMSEPFWYEKGWTAVRRAAQIAVRRPKAFGRRPLPEDRGLQANRLCARAAKKVLEETGQVDSREEHADHRQK